jgi:orotidine-5'-phosphate decarboxylase
MSALAAAEPVIFVALDVDQPNEARAIAEDLSGLGLGFKLGPRLMYREGASIVRDIARHGSVFIDCKHLDIPSTMESAVRTAFDAGASYATIHALAGPQALAQMAKLEAELRQERAFRILNVTILTSFAPETLPFGLRPDAAKASGDRIGHLVDGLAQDAYATGLKSFVCSPHEAALLRGRFPDAFLVTPGIRPAGSDVGDQVRVQTPARAAQAGASALVVGRPILAASHRRDAAQAIQAEFEQAKSKAL